MWRPLLENGTPGDYRCEPVGCLGVEYTKITLAEETCQREEIMALFNPGRHHKAEIQFFSSRPSLTPKYWHEAARAL